MEHSALVILFVDGDLAATRPLRIELRRRGARVDVAASVEMAERLAQADPPDLVILDSGMGKSGPEDLVDRFRTACPRAELILLDASPSSIPRGIGMGLLYSGDKPVGQEVLLDVIDSAFPGRLEKPPGEKHRPGRVLCVDDDPLYLRSLSRTLGRHGYDVFPFEDAPGALTALERIAPDVAILDILMPTLDGYDLADRIRERSGGHVPVVFLTALSSEEAYYAGRNHGARYFLTKPCAAEKVVDVVDYLAGDLDEAERELLRNRI